MITIVLAHPWHGSFNKVILDTITQKLDTDNKAYQVIDLHKDNFNPAFTESDLQVFSKGQYKDPLVGEYQQKLKNSDEIIFIFPIWWGNMPAMLKGFFDKTLLYGFAYNYENGWTPLLTINKTTVITTSEQATDNYKNQLGDPIQYANNTIFGATGMNNVTWLNCDHITSGSDEHRKAFLEKVKKHI
jgi:NAD(P)H dehydrogenase (quinone)